MRSLSLPARLPCRVWLSALRSPCDRSRSLTQTIEQPFSNCVFVAAGHHGPVPQQLQGQSYGQVQSQPLPPAPARSQPAPHYQQSYQRAPYGQPTAQTAAYHPQGVSGGGRGVAPYQPQPDVTGSVAPRPVSPPQAQKS